MLFSERAPRFEREFEVIKHLPFGKASDFVESIENANQEKMTRLVKLVGMMLKTKLRTTIQIRLLN